MDFSKIAVTAAGASMVNDPDAPLAPPEPAPPLVYHLLREIPCRYDMDETDAESPDDGKPPVVRPAVYELADEATVDLIEAADFYCYKCHGSGIKDWRHSGTVARVCPCTKRNVPSSTLQE